MEGSDESLVTGETVTTPYTNIHTTTDLRFAAAGLQLCYVLR